MSKSIIFITIAIIILGILFASISFMAYEPTVPYAGGSSQSSGSFNSISQNITQTGQNQTSGISLAALGQHNSENDCWVGFNGKAYDLTSWLPRHPGSAGAIAPYCGTALQFEQAFTNQHGTRMVDMFMKVAIYKGDLSA